MTSLQIRSLAGRLGLAGLALALLAACQEPDLVIPTAEEVREHYTYRAGELEVEMSGNVAEITVTQPWSQIRRGGSLWARVGPYIFLFSDQTREVFQAYSGLAAVRVTTQTPGSTTIAEALLRRDALNDLTWRRALNIAGKARTQATRRPSLLEDLIRWGEDNTVEHEYNPEFVE